MTNTDIDTAIRKMKFSLIETSAFVRGRRITSAYHFPIPVDYDEYTRIADAHFRAYPDHSHYGRVVGTQYEG